MSDAGSVRDHLAALGAAPEPTDDGGWRLRLESAGHPLVVEILPHGTLLRAQALVLPGGVIDPRQLLFWNGQAPLVGFAENRDGDVIVCGEVPLAALDADMLDRFLGLLHATATRARQFALPRA